MLHFPRLKCVCGKLHECCYSPEYRLPTELAQRRELWELCYQALGFENHYLRVYRDYLLAELASQEHARQLFALGRLAHVLYRDEEVRSALEGPATSLNTAVRQGAEHVLTAIAPVSTAAHR